METRKQRQSDYDSYYPSFSPWGNIQSRIKLADGIYFVSTASHGGIAMGCARQDDMNRAESPWLKSAEFWEEDCDWSIPFIHFAAEIRANMKPAMFIRQFNTAIKTIWFQKDYFDTTINAVTR